MNQKHIESVGHSPLKTQLKEIDSIHDTEGLMRRFGESWGLGIKGPIMGWVHRDKRDPNQYRLQLMQGELGLPDRSYYLVDDEHKQTIRIAYIGYLEALFKLAGELEPKAQASAVYKLEKQLAQAQWDRIENQDTLKTYNKRSREELNAGSAINWDAFFSGLEAQPQHVILYQPSYFSVLTKLLQTTPLPAWKSYLKAQLLSDRAPYLSTAWVALHFQFYQTKISGIKAKKPRWKRATRFVKSILPQAIGKQYIKRHFKPESKARVKAIVTQIVNAFRERINELEWMSPETKTMAQDKLKKQHDVKSPYTRHAHICLIFWFLVLIVFSFQSRFLFSLLFL